ncbi:MAG: UDP-N-acetylglucosamine 1-carboxyvinyltransferase [Clostridiales bacterium]|nr:UDP-N-acetylglucosamine 1-carboxyvinyltransferase [Clostridiales bacterium]
MSILRINGGRALNGEVRIQGAKNSVLPIMAASILAEGVSIIHNCPRLADVDVSARILEHLGCKVSRDGESVCIDSSGMIRSDIPDALMREMRSSVVFLGAILARTGEARLSLPGGCELGPRPIDLHIAALRELGAEIDDNGGKIVCKAKRLKGCRLHLAKPSVGATENAMLAACRSSGTTVITNPAKEPEIWDLQAYLIKLGVSISGAGSSIITVESMPTKNHVEHTVISDRIVAATYLSAVASAGGSIRLTDVNPEHLSTAIDVLNEMGCEIEADREKGIITARKEKRLKAVKPVITSPYPGFPTDTQPPVMAACLKAQGTTVFVENIFENRYRHVEELKRLGAEIKTEGKTAIICGVDRLHGAELQSTDLRGGAALCVAALGAEGISEISGLHHIDRGYDKIENALQALGADIRRTSGA